MHRNRWLFFLAVLSSTHPAPATSVRDGPVEDLTETSADGRLLFMARWPDRRLPRAAAREGVRYSLNDLENDRIVWELAGKDRLWPSDIHVDPTGRVVLLTRDNRLLCLEGSTGLPTLRVQLLNLLTDANRQHVVEYSSGISIGWIRNYFLAHEQRTYFVLRSWWDRRLFFDLDEAVAVETPDRLLLAAAESAEREYVLTHLRSEIQRLEALKKSGSDGCCIGIGFTATSVVLAGGRTCKPRTG